MKRTVVGTLAVLLVAAGPRWAGAQTEPERLLLLEKTIQDLLRRDEERERKLRVLEAEVARLRGRRLPEASRAPGERSNDHGHHHPPSPAPPWEPKHDHAHGPGAKPHDEDDAVWTTSVGDGVLKLRRIGLDLDAAFGWATTRRANVERLFAGGHDPRQNGFTLRAAELSFSGTYDPYFDAYVDVVYQVAPGGDSRFELEEAWFESKPVWGVAALKAGLFLTPFGAINPVHAHDWDFQTQPVILSRLFGEDGHRGVGIQAKFDLPTPWKGAVVLGLQNARGQTQASFLASADLYAERPLAGYAFRPSETNGLAKLVHFARTENVFRLGDKNSLWLGASAMLGPNATGSRGRTIVWGADATLVLALGEAGRLRWIGEFAQRSFRADRQELDDGTGGLVVLPRRTLTDFGFHAALLWDIDGEWTLGARYEYATSRGESINVYAGNGADPFRGNRHRLSPSRFGASPASHASAPSTISTGHRFWRRPPSADRSIRPSSTCIGASASAPIATPGTSIELTETAVQADADKAHGAGRNTRIEARFPRKPARAATKSRSSSGTNSAVRAPSFVLMRARGR